MKLVNVTRNTVIASRLSFAVSRGERRRGLIGRTGMEEGEAMIFPGCRQLHSFGMLFPIDIVFISRAGKILRIYPGFQPRRISSLVLRSSAAIELPPGTLERTGTRVGDMVQLEGRSLEMDKVSARAIKRNNLVRQDAPVA